MGMGASATFPKCRSRPLCKSVSSLVRGCGNENKKAALDLERRYDLGSTSWYSHAV